MVVISLKKCHAIVCLAHFVQAVVILIFAITRRSTVWVTHTLRLTTATFETTTLPVEPLFISFAIALIGCFGHGWAYRRVIEFIHYEYHWIRHLQWALTQPLIFLAVLIPVGLADVYAILNVCAATFATILMDDLGERYVKFVDCWNEKIPYARRPVIYTDLFTAIEERRAVKERERFRAFLYGKIVAIIPWIGLISYFTRTCLGTTAVPWFVVSILWSSFAIGAAITWIQFRRLHQRITFEQAERWHVILSFIQETSLIWQILALT